MERDKCSTETAFKDRTAAPITLNVLLGPILLTVIVPLGTLVHELCHALLALRATRGPVHVIVGRSPGLIRFTAGRLRMSFHIEPADGVDWEGLCVWDPARRPAHLIFVAAAGPIGSGLFAAVCAAAFVNVRFTEGLTLGVALLIGAATGALSVVHDGAGAFSTAARHARPQSDGALLAHFLELHRMLRAHERHLGRQLTVAELGVLRETGRLPRSAHPSLLASVPPPTRRLNKQRS